jgi:hypothetical protein
MYAEASKPLDGLTHTKLCFAPDTPESNISAMLRALHKVPGVLLADAPPGFCCAAIAHDGGVPVAELLKAVSSAGVTATVAPIPLPSIESAPIDNGQRKIFAVFGAFVLTLVLINLRSIFGKIDGSQLILMISLLPLAFCLSFVLEKIVTTSGRKL